MIAALMTLQAVIPQAAPVLASPPRVEPGYVIVALALRPGSADAKPRKAYERSGIIQQQVLPLGGASLRVPDGERKAYRARTGLDAGGTWRAAEWVVPSREPGRRFAHRGWLFCREAVNKQVRLPHCLRDADGDGRFEEEVRVTDARLAFSPIEPVGYGWGDAYWPTNATNYEGVQLSYEPHGDELDFFAQPVGSPGARVSATVPVAPGALPATVRLLGAVLTVHAMDGTRPLVSIDQPMTIAPIRMVRAPLAADPTRIGLHVELVEAPPPPERAGLPRP